MAPGPGDTDDADGEWRFSLSDIEARNDEGGVESDDDDGGNVAGSFGPAETIEAGEIDAENALFVLVGVALAVLAVAGFAAVFP